MVDERGQADARRFAEQWIAASLDTAALTESDRQQIVDGIQRVYRAEGVPWPDRVIWVGSPQELIAESGSPNPLIVQWTKDEDRRAVYSAHPRLAHGVLKLLAGSAVRLMKRRDRQFERRRMAEPSDFHIGKEPWPEYRKAFSERDLKERPGQSPGRSTPLTPQYVYAALRQIDDMVSEALWEVWSPILPDWNSGSITRERLMWWAGWIWRAGYELELNVDEHDRQVIDGLTMAHRAFGWTAYHRLTLVCEPPLELHVERVGERYRLHNTAGPAVVWAGAAKVREYRLHGVPVPEYLFRDDVSVRELHALGDPVVRWLAIERMGWLRYVEEAGLRLVAAASDPVDELLELRLYDLPEKHFEPGRVLVTVPGRNRSDPQYCGADVVPGDLADPLQAVAWLYGCSMEEYLPVTAVDRGNLLLLATEMAAPVAGIRDELWRDLPPTGVDLWNGATIRGSWRLDPGANSAGISWIPGGDRDLALLGHLHVPPGQSAYLQSANLAPGAESARSQIGPGSYAIRQKRPEPVVVSAKPARWHDRWFGS